MTIRDVETWIRDVETPVAVWREGLPASGGRETEALIRVIADDGVVGRCYLSGGWGRVAAAIVPRRISPLFVGTDELAREAAFAAIWSLDRIEELPIYLLGAIDVALWDIAARRAQLPLYRFLGSARTAIAAYASTATFASVDEYLDVADQCLDLGYRAIKLHAWGDARRDAELAQRLRSHVGPGITLLYDGSAAFGFTDALWLGRALEEAGFGWYEEPMREFAVDSYRRLASRLDIPILGAETSDGVHYTATEWLATGACDLVRTGWWFKGGVTGSMRIAHIADGFGRTAEVHGSGAVNLHLACAISNTTYYEAMTLERAVRRDQYVHEDGAAHPPESPGAWGDEVAEHPPDDGWVQVGSAP